MFSSSWPRIPFFSSLSTVKLFSLFLVFFSTKKENKERLNERLVRVRRACLLICYNELIAIPFKTILNTCARARAGAAFDIKKSVVV